MPRADAARLAGMDRQTLRDAVVRYNAKGLEGLHDRPKGYSPRRLTADEEAALAAVIIAGPEPERDGVCAWTRADLCRWLEERFAKTYHPSSMTRVLRRMGFSRQKARPSHPRRDAEAQERFKKRGLRDILKATAGRIPTSAYSCGFRMKRASATRAGCVTGGGAGASVRRDASNRLPVGLHLLRRAPGHRRRRHPGDAERQRQVMDLLIAHYPGPGCARRDLTTAPSPSPQRRRCCRLNRAECLTHVLDSCCGSLQELNELRYSGAYRRNDFDSVSLRRSAKRGRDVDARPSSAVQFVVEIYDGGL